MRYLYLAAFIAGLLLAVRLMFFGAERRRQRPGVTPLRRSEPAAVGFLVMFGVAGYLVSRYGAMSTGAAVGTAAVFGVAWAAVVARLAIIMARLTPEHDPEDPRFRLQGHVGVVTVPIPAGGLGEIAWVDASGPRTAMARSASGDRIDVGAEVCIERIDDGVALVEPWSIVEARL